jgi:CRISPR/Cas system-associated exonuclease Cas4 (RecB family)
VRTMDSSSIIRRGSRVASTGLTRYIMKGLKKTEKRWKRKKLYCGDASYCPRRATLFSATEGVSEFTAAGRFYMDTGTTVHEIIQEVLMQQGVLLEAERRVDITLDGLTTSGRIDGILNIDGETKILEIKTCGALPSAPKKEHLHQALTYSLLTGIRKVIIFYMSRKVASYDGRLECVEFTYDVTDADLDMVATLLAASVVGATRRVLPPIPPHITSQRDCGFCPFTNICFGDEKVDLPPFERKHEVRVEKVKAALLKMSDEAYANVNS